jgi:hypothetical protein
MTPRELKKHEKAIYMKRWRDSKKVHGIATHGKMLRKTYNTTNTEINKFTLDRDFALTDKEIQLMLSYLNSWKGLARLEPNEITILSRFEGRNPVNLLESARGEIRALFYGARNRVVDKTKSVSSMIKEIG